MNKISERFVEYFCRKCKDFTSSSYAELEKHIQWKHDVVDNIKMEKKKYFQPKCKDCTYTANTKKQIRLHFLKNHFISLCKNCSKMYPCYCQANKHGKKRNTCKHCNILVRKHFTLCPCENN